MTTPGSAFKAEYDRMVELHGAALNRKLEAVAQRSLRVVHKELEGDRRLDAAKVGLSAWARRAEAKREAPAVSASFIVLPADARLYLTPGLSIPAGQVVDAERTTDG